MRSPTQSRTLTNFDAWIALGSANRLQVWDGTAAAVNPYLAPATARKLSVKSLHPDSDRLSSINKMRSRIRQRTSLSSDSSFAALGSASMTSPPDLNHTSSSISISLTAPQPVLHNNNSNHSTERASCNSQGTTSVSSRSHNYFTRSRSNISNKG